MPLAPGTRLGAYEITGLLGAGGMGEVYRARDSKLKREVAIKVLPEAFALDPDRLARFTREAEVLASLNHPNIAAIYGIEQAGGAQALVLEIVEGPTLADVIAQTAGSRLQASGATPQASAPSGTRGATARGGGAPRGLEIDDVLSIARQIADALDAAHGQNIVHRDLKPANIKLRSDGVVKVLDFGLAKAITSEGEDRSEGDFTRSPTMASPAQMTSAGAIMGTAAYMAPEQARGRAVDKRADIWAFGCVLYEMLTGRPAFEGSDASEIMAGVIKADVRWEALPADTPPVVRRLLRRCLQKDPKARLRDVGDARMEIEDALAAPAAEVHPMSPATERPRSRLALTLTAVLTLVLFGGIAAWLFKPEAPETTDWFSILPTRPQAWSLYPTVSPDGRRLVYTLLNDAGEPQLWVRAFDDPTDRPLPGTERAVWPFWSPDSRSIAFFAAGKMKRLDIGGGSPQDVTDVPAYRGSGTWGANGVILFGTPYSGLWQVSAAGGVASELTTLDTDHRESEHSSPYLMPDGQSFLYTVRSSEEGRTGIYTRPLSGGEATFITHDYSRAEYSHGFLLFGRGVGLYAQKYDAAQRRLIGEAFRVAERIGFSRGNLSFYAFSTSPDGPLVFSEEPYNPVTQLVLTDREGRQLARVGEPGEHIGFALAPDEQSIALERRDPGTNTMDLWLMTDLTSPGPTRFTSTTSAWHWSGVPVWMPGSDRVLFTEFTDHYQLKGTSGRGPAGTERLEHRLPPSGGWPQHVTPDGRWILTLINNDRQTGDDLWRVSTGTEQPVSYLNSRFNERQPRHAPEGPWIAYTLDESGRGEVYVDSFPIPGSRMMVSEGGGAMPMWSMDGREIYYLAPDGNVMMVGVEVSPTAFRKRSPPRALFQHPPLPFSLVDSQRAVYQVLGNGERFIFAAAVSDTRPRGATVVTNWATNR